MAAGDLSWTVQMSSQKECVRREREMQSAMEKLSNMGCVAKEKLTICRAKMEEKVENATAKTADEKRIAKEKRKAKEAEAKRELHEAKAKHAAQKLSTKKAHLHGGHGYHQAAAGEGVAGSNIPAYPLAGHAHMPGHKF